MSHSRLAVLVGLSLAAVLGFWAVNGLVRSFDRKQLALAARLAQQGDLQQRNKHADQAVASFRAALSYERGNFEYELGLAKALIDAGRYEEAQAYLVSLRERAPERGEVNVELARLAAREGDAAAALRYYHNAIYGIWSDDPDNRRRQARRELVSVLLQHDDLSQARAELIASATSLPPDPAVRLPIAGLFMQAQDYQDALQQYREVLRVDSKNVSAMAGAGKSAFHLGEFSTAQHYLRAASQQDASDMEVGKLLEAANQILESDPFRRGISDRERRHRIAVAFEEAGARLQSCLTQADEGGNETAVASLRDLQVAWAGFQPRFRGHSLLGDSATGDQAMDMVFRIEQQTQALCGQPQGLDFALLMIANNRQAVER